MVKNFFPKIFFILIFSFTGRLTFSAEGDTYSFSWLDSDKEVFVLQNRKYRKRGKVYVNAGAGISTSGAFTDSNFFQVRGGYFFLEEWGLEGLYTVHKGKEDDTFESVKRRAIPFRRILESYRGAMLLWSPFYAKINTFNQIIYADWMLGVGFVSLQDKHNRQGFLANTIRPDTSESHTGLIWDTALKIFLSKNWEVRADLTTVHYQAEGPDGQKEWNDNWDVGLSLGYSF